MLTMVWAVCEALRYGTWVSSSSARWRRAGHEDTLLLSNRRHGVNYAWDVITCDGGNPGRMQLAISLVGSLGDSDR